MIKDNIENKIRSSTLFSIKKGNASGTFQGYRIVFGDGVHVSFGCIDNEFDDIYAAILTANNVIDGIIMFNDLPGDIKEKLELIVSDYLKDNIS